MAVDVWSSRRTANFTTVAGLATRARREDGSTTSLRHFELVLPKIGPQQWHGILIPPNMLWHCRLPAVSCLERRKEEGHGISPCTMAGGGNSEYYSATTHLRYGPDFNGHLLALA